MNSREYFQHEQIEKGLIRIIGMGNELSYLIIGSKKAALVDTGAGVGNIREYVESLTDLPIIVILTHAHIDHSAGSFYFNQVYMTAEDAKLLDMEFNNSQCNEMKNIIIQFVNATNPQIEELTMEEIVTPYKRKFELLSDGDVFDIGDISLEIIACPGHTKGSVMILIKELRIMIFGDSCNPNVWLHLPESTSVLEYRHSLLRIKSREVEYDRVLLSHFPRDINKVILDEIIDVCEEVMDGKCDEIPYECDECYNAYIAKKQSGEDYNIQADGIVGNIIYKK
ncbi:MBL fold metallo-hydrolase [Anaeromicropila herbilytica]|uniref:MBL fold metallo-hydrolase n=1 Tax=Anaeromicropila herbilytica TaxID=2785025 RepID=A0A7R7EL43_9FIRM|nr:MBL fold metallo-hydrolase [Anaeromicropila herbilytica]BCN30840.1 MBL fold metallo-hydrolase [Anaeromicropila herbilytica]